MKNSVAQLLLLSILSSTGCSVLSIQEIPNVEFQKESSSDKENSPVNVSVTEKRIQDWDLLKSRPGKEIADDLHRLDPFFKKKNIENIYVRVSLEDIQGSCPSCLFIWPEFITANIQVEWAIREKVGSEYSYKIINVKKISYKEYTQIFLFPFGIGKLIWNIAAGEWDSELGIGRNLFGFTDFEKAAAKLNKLMVKEVIDNNYKLPEN